MAKGLLERHFENGQIAWRVRKSFLKGLSLREPARVVDKINILTARASCDQTVSKDERFCRHGLFTLFRFASPDFRAEESERLGRPDFVLERGGQTWIL